MARATIPTGGAIGSQIGLFWNLFENIFGSTETYTLREIPFTLYLSQKVHARVAGLRNHERSYRDRITAASRPARDRPATAPRPPHDRLTTASRPPHDRLYKNTAFLLNLHS